MLSLSSGLGRSVGGLRSINRQPLRIGPQCRYLGRGDISLSTSRRVGARSGFSTANKRSQSLPSNVSSSSTPVANSGSATAAAAAVATGNGVVPPLPMWQRLGPLTTFFRFYGRSQATRPYATQFFSSLVIFSLGDLFAQYLGGEEYDAKRTLRVLVISGTSSVPAYRWLVYVGQSFNYSSKLLSLATKVVVNQIVWAPVFGTYYFSMQSLLSGNDLAQTWERVKTTVPITVRNACLFWPPITAMTFRFISPTYQAVTLAAVATGWQSYLSYTNRKTDDSVATHKLTIAA